MLYKRWKTPIRIIGKKNAQRSSELNWLATDKTFTENWASTNDFQEQFVNHLMLQKAETLFVVNDKEKRERRFLQVSIVELNKLNQLRSLVRELDDVESKQLRLCLLRV